MNLMLNMAHVKAEFLEDHKIITYRKYGVNIIWIMPATGRVYLAGGNRILFWIRW
jgi:hypothetical protein